MVMVVPSAMVDMNGINVSGWQPAGITRQVQADFAVAKVTQNTGFVNTAWRVQARRVGHRQETRPLPLRRR